MILGDPHILEGPGEEPQEAQKSGLPPASHLASNCGSRDCADWRVGWAPGPSLIQSGNCSAYRGGGREAAAARLLMEGEKAAH